jgi:subtilase-type serine protease
MPMKGVSAGYMAGLLRALLCTIAIFLLAACGGGGGSNGSGDSGWTPPPPPNPFSATGNAWVTASVAGQFNPTAASALAASPEFAAVNATYSNYTGHPYRLTRLAAAQTGINGYTGAGQTVAVVDDGFLQTHQEITGRIIGTYGDVSIKTTSAGALSSHGTHVAALIAGDNAQDGTMFGVAPDADLFLATFATNMAGLAAGTIAAHNAGAVVQNNSWGFLSSDLNDITLPDVQRHAQTNSVSLPSALAAVSGISLSGWNTYADALETFQTDGVIVWALSNSSTLSQPDASAALPIIYPELQGAWISVGNGAFDLDANGRITRSLRLSAACGQMATQCIFADGSTRSAAATGNTDYRTGTGSSFAAPQVAGAVALLAQAFPSLSPQEWTKRLLASAYGDFPGFTANGTVNFGNGVTRRYSDQWGYGVLDITAALSPIGSLAIARGDTLATATRTDASQSSIAAGTGFGDGVAGLLAGRSIALFDALNADFHIDAQNFARIGTTHLSPAIPRLTGSERTDPAMTGAWGLVAGRDEITFGESGFAMGLAALDGEIYLQERLGLASDTVTGASILSLAEHTTAMVGRYETGFGSLETFGFAATHTQTRDGGLTGVGGALTLEADPLSLTFGLTQISEQGAFLGMTASDAFALPSSTTLSAMSLGASADLSDRLTLFGGLEYGLASGGVGAGLLSEIDPASFSGFQIGMRASELFLPDDGLTVSVSQPLRVETGQMHLNVPVGRTIDGAILYDTISGSIAPSGRQLDLGLAYQFAPVPDALLRFGFVYSHDAGHVAGRKAAAIGAAFTQAF